MPAAMVAGISYAIANMIVTHRLGMELPAIISSFVSMMALTVFLKFWKPASIWRFPGEPEVRQELEKKYTTAQVVKAWSPFVVLMAIMGLWGIPSFKSWIVNELRWIVIISQWPGLHGLVYTTVPGAKPAMYGAGYRWEFFTAPGTAMFFAGPGDRDQSVPRREGIRGNVQTTAFRPDYSFFGYRYRVPGKLLGHVLYPGSDLRHLYGDAVPNLLSDHRMAGSFPDRIGYVLCRLVR